MFICSFVLDNIIYLLKITEFRWEILKNSKFSSEFKKEI